MSTEYERLVILLRSERLKVGMRQVDLARKVRLSQQAISAIENLRTATDIDQVRRICNALGIDMVELVREWLDAVEPKRRKKRSSK